MTPEDDPQLWNLLGKMPAPELSPFFARNVAREIRQRPQSRFGARARRWILGGTLVPISGLAAILLLGVMGKNFHGTQSHLKTSSADVASQNDGADDELLMDLDDVVSGDDSTPSVEQSIL